MIRWDATPEGIVVLTLDDPQQGTNTMNDRYFAAMASTLDRLEAQRDSITGVVWTSAKPTGFLAGADLKTLGARTGPGNPGFELVEQMKSFFRRIEKLGKPTVAALNGTALGGGLEHALACHHRIAVDAPKAVYGLPEVTLGLLPGAGGTVRVPRLIGITDALLNVLLQGQRMKAGKAKEVGIVDAVVSTLDELLPAAYEWIRANPDATQPWERKGYKLPGGNVTDRALASLLPSFPANLRKQLKGANYPAPLAIMSSVVEGAAVDIDTALRIESRWFASLLGSRVQRNMTTAFFHELGQLNRGASRPAGVEPWQAGRVGIVGAGMMGAGIAFAAARSGLTVTLVDTTLEKAAAGRDYSIKALRKATPAAIEEHLAHITPADNLEALADCDIVIEAVFEDLELKQATFTKLVEIVGPETVLATNTSSLPVTTIAAALPDPSRLVGLHFFSPVDRMQLVEIVRAGKTSDATLARGFDVVRQLGKTPIVVNDSRGFFTSRVFGTYIMEGVALLAEGVPAASVEQAATQAGYPVGPLAVMDEVSLSLSRRVRLEAAKAGVVNDHPAGAVIDRMVDEFDRPGKAAGRGFYDYPADARKHLWPGLASAFGATVPPPLSLPELQDRMLFAEVLESVRCLDEGVLTSKADGDIGSIFGIGFPGWTGGVLQFIETYPGGVAGFVARARELAAAYGDRFAPPPSLVARVQP